MLKEMSITLLNQLMQPHSPLTQAAAKMDNALKSLLLFIDNHSPVRFENIFFRKVIVSLGFFVKNMI